MRYHRFQEASGRMQYRQVTRMTDPLTAAQLYQLGRNYYLIRNYSQAAEYLTEAVIKGSSGAARLLMDMGKLLYRRGAAGDYTLAERCFQPLADRGSGESCLYLGRMCAAGLGRKKDVRAAFDYFDEAYQLGCGEGAFEAGRLILPDAWVYEEARQAAIGWFKAAADDGIIRANTEIGLLLCDNIPEHNAEALTWFVKGIHGGDTDAMVYASDLYLGGMGVPKNEKIAVNLLVQAARGGNKKANTILGDMYASGDYVEKNKTRAIEYYKRAKDCDR